MLGDAVSGIGSPKEQRLRLLRGGLWVVVES